MSDWDELIIQLIHIDEKNYEPILVSNESLRNWVFHPSIQRQTVTSKATMYRYPSPGSDIPNSDPADYRAPFSTS